LTKALFTRFDLGSSTLNMVNLEFFDAITGAWTSARLGQDTNLASATSVGSKVFFAGASGHNDNTASADVYDASTGTISTTPFGSPRTSLAAISVNNKALFPRRGSA